MEKGPRATRWPRNERGVSAVEVRLVNPARSRRKRPKGLGDRGGGGKRGGEGGRQKEEKEEAGCVRVVPCGIGRRAGRRHAFLLGS